jgi:hypothetical protein
MRRKPLEFWKTDIIQEDMETRYNLWIRHKEMSNVRWKARFDVFDNDTAFRLAFE